MATNVVLLVVVVVLLLLLLLLLSDFQNTKTFSFHNQSSLNFASDNILQNRTVSDFQHDQQQRRGIQQCPHGQRENKKIMAYRWVNAAAWLRGTTPGE